MTVAEIKEYIDKAKEKYQYPMFAPSFDDVLDEIKSMLDELKENNK